MRKFAIVILFVLLCLCSCKTVETQTEYVPVTLDIEELIEPITELRPQDPQLIDAPSDLSDIMENSVSFQYAYENWKAYALSLEQFYTFLVDEQEKLVSTT